MVSKTTKKKVPDTLEYKGFRIVFTMLRQRHVEAWMTYVDLDEKILPKRLGSMVRAAFKAGWFTEPVLDAGLEDPIAEWPPERVNWLANVLSDKYSEIMDFDPS